MVFESCFVKKKHSSNLLCKTKKLNLVQFYLQQKMGFAFDNKKFDPKQNSNYKKLQFIFGLAFWLFIASVVLMFWYGKFMFLLAGFTIYFVLRINTNRCVNCMTFNSLEEKGSRGVNFSDYDLKGGPLMILEAKTMHCKKCGFICDKLVERTGNYEGVAAMGRERKKRKLIEFLRNSNKKSTWR